MNGEARNRMNNPPFFAAMSVNSLRTVLDAFPRRGTSCTDADRGRTIANVGRSKKRTDLAVRSIKHRVMHRCASLSILCRSSLVILAIASVLPFAFGQDAADMPFHTAASVKALTIEQAERGLPSLIRGVVTCSTDFGIFVQDNTAGIWLRWKHPRDFNPGDEIEVKGRTDAGEFSPVIQAEVIRKLGHAPMPYAKPVTVEQLLRGDEDAQYITITGLVRSIEVRANVPKSQDVWLKVAVNGGTIYATLPERDAGQAATLVDATIRISAPATATKNQNRQITSVVLPMPSIQNLIVTHAPPKDLFAAPLLPIGRLMQYRSGTDNGHRVRVIGTVTYFQSGETLILQGERRAILIKTAQRGEVRVGDHVEAVGFPTPAPSGPFLQDAVFRYAGTGTIPEPAHVTAADLASGRFNNILVSIDAKVLHRIDEPESPTLLLLDGPTLVRAEIDRPRYASAFGKVREGSFVKVTGISFLDVEGLWNYAGPTASTVHYKLLLRSPEDVQELRAPSWWTAPHLFYLIAVLGILMFIFFGLALYGRMDRLRLQAVLHERERLAHDIHDTLAQSFAGIGFQIQAIRRAIPDEMSQLRQQVDLARALVRHSHKEARRSIQPYDLEPPEDVNLMVALQTSTQRMVNGGSIIVAATTTGDAHPLPARITEALLHIGQEAVANAVRHGDPSHLSLALAYQRHSVELAVNDDGCGFQESGDLLGFGLRGMRKRAAGISAKMDIVSSPGAGTRVTIVCPLPTSHSLNSLLERIRHFSSKNRLQRPGEQQND